MKNKYPIESFALLLILFSGNTASVLMSGMVLLLSLCFAGVITAAKGKSLAAAVVCGAVNILGVIGCFYYIGLASFLSVLPQAAALGISAAIYAYREKPEEISINELIYFGSVSLAAALILGAAREYLANGELFGFELTKTALVSTAYQKSMFGFIASFLYAFFAGQSFGAKSDLGVITVLIGTVSIGLSAFIAQKGIKEALIIPALALLLVWAASLRTAYSSSFEKSGEFPLNIALGGFAFMLLGVL